MRAARRWSAPPSVVWPCATGSPPVTASTSPTSPSSTSSWPTCACPSSSEMEADRERNPDMYARSNTLMGNPQAMDEGIAYIRDEVMPLVQGMDGFVGLSMLCDRDTGRCIVTTAWESQEAMRASDQGVQSSRARAAEVFGGAAPEVREWEVAVMHRMHEGHDGARARVIWARGTRPTPGT